MGGLIFLGLLCFLNYIFNSTGVPRGGCSVFPSPYLLTGQKKYLKLCFFTGGYIFFFCKKDDFAENC